MKFDKIIMNPPYNGSLHLQILSEAMKHADEVVNLSPIRWLQDPLAEYKSGTYKKHKNIINYIESLDIVPSLEAERLFNIGLPYNLGIYHITKEGGWKNPFKNELVDKMLKKIIAGDNVDNHIVYDDLSGLCLLVSLFTGGQGGRIDAIDSFSLRREKCFFTDGKNEITGESYLEQRTKSAWGNVKVKSVNTNIKFNTKEERENFYNSWNTKCLLWLFNKEKTDVNVNPKFLPWLGDYTHSWTDEMLYDYFNLTKEEREIIEKQDYECSS